MEGTNECLFSFLPQDALAVVFGFAISSVANFSLVCLEWNAVCKSPYVW
jgi:hypothetical protein